MSGVSAPPGLRRRPEWGSMSRHSRDLALLGKRCPAQFPGRTLQLALIISAFSPPPTGLPMVPITIAAVGPAMLRLAGRHCDGVRLHAFRARAYAEQIVYAGDRERPFPIWA